MDTDPWSDPPKRRRCGWPIWWTPIIGLVAAAVLAPATPAPLGPNAAPGGATLRRIA